MIFLPPANEVWGKVMFLHLSVSHSVHGGLCMMSLPVWLPGPMFLLGGLCPWSHVPSLGVSVQGASVQGGSLSGGFFPGGVSVQGTSVQGVSVQGVLCPRGSLSNGFSIEGGLCRETLPPESEKQAVLLECFLVCSVLCQPVRLILYCKKLENNSTQCRLVIIAIKDSFKLFNLAGFSSFC